MVGWAGLTWVPLVGLSAVIFLQKQAYLHLDALAALSTHDAGAKLTEAHETISHLRRQLESCQRKNQRVESSDVLLRRGSQWRSVSRVPLQEQAFSGTGRRTSLLIQHSQSVLLSDSFHTSRRLLHADAGVHTHCALCACGRTGGGGSLAAGLRS